MKPRPPSAAASRALGGLALATLSTLATACSGTYDGEESIGTSAEAITPIEGVDYSWYRPVPSSLASSGYHFVARYLSYDTTGKSLSPAEASSLKAAGLDLVVVWEESSTGALSGYSQGVSDAHAAESQATADGKPSTRPIYFAVDFDVQPGQLAAVEAYFSGVASVLGVSRTGVYGGYYAVKELFNGGKVAWGWQTYAWSGGQWDSRAHLRQVQNGIAGGEMDLDTGVAVDFGQWGPYAPPPPPPPPAPRGSLDVASCTSVSGWTQETTVPTTALFADIDFNGPAGAAGVTAFRLTANESRSDLCTAIGSCDHAFSMSTPRRLLDGASHKVYAYGINHTAGGPSTLLAHAPKTITCAAPAITPGDVKRHVTSPTILTDWRFDMFTDEAPYPTTTLAAVPDGADFGSAPDIVQVTGNPAIYAVDDGFRRHIGSPAVFAAWRMKSSDIKPISAAALAALEAGPDWPATPLLVKDASGPAVYLLDVPFPPPALPDAGANDGAADDAAATNGDAGVGPSDAAPFAFVDGGVEVDGQVPAPPVLITDGGDVSAEDAGAGSILQPGEVAQAGSAGGCSTGGTTGGGTGFYGVSVALGALLVTRRRARRSGLRG